ncbi:hypothetical protein EVAR_101861_1 [Eumeta japonica]|uniref:Uncharacterized protein n=1 Tax=Eumeta variegata TaxID=151549 RepID=A0A4C1SNP7_EUMVA|nr:hypothetical protein EVAR_101861_1 [Eumeta japonica]
MENASPCPPGVGGVAKNEVTHALIKDMVTKALQNMGYECPENDLDRFVRSATPESSRASSSTTTPASSQSSSSQTSRSHSLSEGNKRRASSRSENEISSPESSDSTVRTVQKALKRSKLVGSPPANRMDVDTISVAASTFPKRAQSQSEPQGSATTPSQVVIDDQGSPRAGVKSTAHPRTKAPPQSSCAKALTSSKYSQTAPVC